MLTAPQPNCGGLRARQTKNSAFGCGRRRPKPCHRSGSVAATASQLRCTIDNGGVAAADLSATVCFGRRLRPCGAVSICGCDYYAALEVNVPKTFSINSGFISATPLQLRNSTFACCEIPQVRNLKFKSAEFKFNKCGILELASAELRS